MNITQAFESKGLIEGRLLSSSKSRYREKYPNNRVFFNANIFVLGEGKIWWGDIDINRDKDVLEEISILSEKKLYIISEMDGRFENENLSDEQILNSAIEIIG